MTTTRSPILPLGPVRAHGTLREIDEFRSWDPLS